MARAKQRGRWPKKLKTAALLLGIIAIFDCVVTVAFLLYNGGLALHAPSLCAAAEHGDLKAVRRLLDNGSDPDETDARGSSAIMYAAGGGNLEVVRVLMARGAKVGHVSGDQWTAMFWARDEPTMRFLVDQGLDLNARDDLGSTPLYWAAYWGSMARVKAFARVHADPWIRGHQNWEHPPTPAETAAREGYKEIAAFLRAYEKVYGAEPGPARPE
jgi:ankyrin repeat protein